MKTKDRILQSSLALFNTHGVVTITTNHIAKELNISPGNLYFHYQNKEDIVRNIFQLMCDETYALWDRPRAEPPGRPIEMIQKNFEIFWRYRCFHREMYYLRRKDPELAKMWKVHMLRVVKLMRITYRRWVKSGWMRKFESFEEMNFLAHALLATASNYLQVFESSDKRPNTRHIDEGIRFVARLLSTHTTGSMQDEFKQFLTGPFQSDHHN